MTTIRQFQATVLCSLVLYIAWFVLPWVDVRYPAEVAAILAYDGFSALIPAHHPAVYLIFFFARVIAALGLLFLFSWGRWLLIAYLVFGTLLIPFRGLAVDAPTDVLIGNLLAMLDGAILAISFLPPISAYMRRDDGK